MLQIKRNVFIFLTARMILQPISKLSNRLKAIYKHMIPGTVHAETNTRCALI
jgi:hypothetical protein